MKKHLFYLAVLISTVISCTHDSGIEKKSSESRISEVLTETNYSTQKIMYSLLNEQEKFKIWNDKIDTILANKNLTKKQSELIQELKNNLSINLFKDGVVNDEREIFKSIFVTSFLKKTINVFNEDFIINNFYYITENSANATRSSELPDCTCNIGSMWSCSGSFECRDSNKCKDTTHGCGFLTFFECTGRCFLY